MRHKSWGKVWCDAVRALEKYGILLTRAQEMKIWNVWYQENKKIKPKKYEQIHQKTSQHHIF